MWRRTLFATTSISVTDNGLASATGDEKTSALTLSAEAFDDEFSISD
ncbi:unnamed protein product, partial [marine sediment metagenome]